RAAAHLRADPGGAHQNNRHASPRHPRKPSDLDPRPEPLERPDQGRAEQHREAEATGGVYEVEPYAPPHVYAKLREAVVAVGHPVAHILERREGEAKYEADERQR